MEKISVTVRFRPPIGQEQRPSGRCWKIDGTLISLHRSLPGQPAAAASPPFAFDHVFDESSTNTAVYDILTRPIIDAAVQGFNGTVFAYGQTSSGKTFTMNSSDDNPGIIRLAIRDVFHLTQMITDREFLIRVSYMEIYNEDINDLLSLENQKLPVHESLERGVFVAGLREEIVNNAEQVLELIKLGEANRHFGETNMNARSSRSHTIFSMVIESSFKDPKSSGDASNADAIRVSVLNLVDLAGSERIAKTGAEGVRLKEGKHINKSLMALGNVINKLSEGKQRGHIPYRDSKLTRILQPALGGNAKTSIICTVAPEEIHLEETRGTLQFATRAKRITNCAQVNEILTDAALLKRQKLEIEELRQKLKGSHSEILEQVILKQRNDMLKSEMEQERLKRELDEERKSREALELCVREQQKKIEDLINLSVSSDQTHSTVLGYDTSRQLVDEVFDMNQHIRNRNIFGTPTSEAVHSNFVFQRSNYNGSCESSPLPENFTNVADEDMWLQLNKGCTTDLDTLQISPNVIQQSKLCDIRSGPAPRETSEKESFGCVGTSCRLCGPLVEDARKQSDLLEEENASLRQALSFSKQNADVLTKQKEGLMRDVAAEKQKLKDLKEDIRLFAVSFTQRQGLLADVRAKSKAMFEDLKGRHPTAAPELY